MELTLTQGQRAALGILAFLFLTSAGAVFAATSVGPNSPTAGATDSSNGGTQNWSHEERITASDSSRAEADLNKDGGGEISRYLRASGFGFSIPSGATINGIAVSIERQGENVAGVFKDVEVRLVTAKSGAAATSSSNKADTATIWPTGTDGTASYGGSADTWGNSWTPEQINDGSFGVLLSVQNTGSQKKKAKVNYISVTVTYSTDTTAPSASGVHIQSNNADTTKAKVGDQITLSFTASEQVTTPVVTIAGHSASVATTSGNSFNATYTVVSGDSEGTIPFSITLTDSVGNTASAVTTTNDSSAVVFDKTAPTLAEVTPVPSPTKNTVPGYTFSSTEAGSITYGGDCSSGTAAASSGNNTVTFNTLGAGTHSNCTVTVTDATGNASSALGVSSFTIDTTAPTGTISTGESTPTNNVSIGFTVDFSESVSDFTSSGNITVQSGSASINDFTPVSGTQYTFTLVPQAEGAITLVIPSGSVHDAAGNATAADATYSITFASSTPSITITSPSAGATSTNSIAMAFIPAKSPTSGLDIAGVECQLDGGGFNPCDTTTSHVFSGLSDGSHTVYALVTDTAANSSLANVDFTVDTQAPTVSLPNGDIATTTASTSGAVVSWSMSADDGSGSGVASGPSCTADFGSGEEAVVSGQTFPQGDTTVTCSATDNAGNTGSASFTVSVEDKALESGTFDGADSDDTEADADGTYEHGWRWIFHFTLPFAENRFQMKFSDFTDAADDMIPAGSNIRYYTAQSSEAADANTAVEITDNEYPTFITLDGDADNGAEGRQVDVVVEMKIPEGTQGGSYDGTWDVLSSKSSAPPPGGPF